MSHNYSKRRRGFHGVVNRITAMSYGQLAVLYTGLLLGFGMVYYLLATFAPSHGPSLPQAYPLLRLMEAMYFSTMTATTVGYGDIAPHGLSKILVGFQAISSLFIFAVLVSKPISERQETALYQMHQLTFDEIFSATREGFFIVRKDLDRVMEEIRTHGKLTERDYEDLTTAYREGQVLLEEIPKFYDTEKKLYIIDERREELLLESVERTMDRVRTLIEKLDRAHIAWRKEARSITQMDEFIDLAKQTVLQWRKQSPHAVRATFFKLEELIREIETKRKLA